MNCLFQLTLTKLTTFTPVHCSFAPDVQLRIIRSIDTNSVLPLDIWLIDMQLTNCQNLHNRNAMWETTPEKAQQMTPNNQQLLPQFHLEKTLRAMCQDILPYPFYGQTEELIEVSEFKFLYRRHNAEHLAV